MNSSQDAVLPPAGEGVFTFPTYGGNVRLCPTKDALTPFGGGLVPWAAFQKQCGLIEALAATCPVRRARPNAAPGYDALTSLGLMPVAEVSLRLPDWSGARRVVVGRRCLGEVSKGGGGHFLGRGAARVRSVCDESAGGRRQRLADH